MRYSQDWFSPFVFLFLPILEGLFRLARSWLPRSIICLADILCMSTLIYSDSEYPVNMCPARSGKPFTLFETHYPIFFIKQQCFCQTNTINPILGITLLNNAFLESKDHNSDSKNRMMKRNKNLTQQVAGTQEPNTLVNGACSHPLNTCPYEHPGDKGHFWIRATLTLTHTIITATSQNNITPKGITRNKPSHFLTFQAFETWVLAMQPQPEYNCML